jgi:hypothetical protein
MGLIPKELAVPVDGKKGIALTLPDDQGEDAIIVTLILPTGERVAVAYNHFYGSIELTVYEGQDGSDEGAPGSPEMRPKICHLTAWIDKFDKDGKYISALHPAPVAPSDHPNGDQHQRLTSQIYLHVAKGDAERQEEDKS